MKIKRRTLATATVITAAAVLLTGTNASAITDAPSDADGVAQVVADVAPNSDLVIPTENADGTFTAQTTQGAVALPESGDGAIEQGDLSIALPGDGSAEVATDGTVVYSDDDTSVAVQNEGDAVRVQTILNDATITSFTYDVAGAKPTLRTDGGVDLVSTEQGPSLTDEIVASVDAPWALDANGKPVPTKYRIVGSSIVQEVSVGDDTAFPVVADPRITFGIGIYVNLSRVEIVALAIAGGTIVALGSGAGCALIAARVPGRGGQVGAYICGALDINRVFELIRGLPSTAGSYYTAACYQYRFPAQSPPWKPVSAATCN